MATTTKVKVASKPSALAVPSVDEWAQTLSLSDLHVVAGRLHRRFYWWMGWPTADRASEIAAEIPMLNGCIDFEVLKRRWSLVKAPMGGKRIAAGRYEIHLDADGATIWGPTLGELAPELVEVRVACIAAIKAAAGTPREKAEAWLRPIAEDADSDGELEALVYFASRGRPPIASGELYRRWYSRVCEKVERVLQTGSPELAEKASAKAIALDAAADVLARSHSLRFLTFFDNEDASIDATFVRAVDWLGVPGFERWLDDALELLAMGPDSGLDAEGAWRLFLALRSDLSLRAVSDDAQRAWLFKFIVGGLEKGRPWVELAWEKPPARRTRVAVAASLVFAWFRFQPSGAPNEAVSEALRLVTASQLGVGAWPMFMDDAEGSLLTTCVAVHALAVARPPGWEALARYAAQWLQAQQDVYGYWYMEGGPTVLLTVLALDCLSIADGGSAVTFTKRSLENVNTTSASAHVAEVPEPEYSYEDEAWHDPQPPELRSVRRGDVSLGEAPLLVAVATDVELAQVLRVLRPLYRKQKLLKVSASSGTYFVGTFGAFPAVVVQCTMGTEGPGGATLTVDHAIREWSPRAVLMVGIAFGVDRRKQLPGDVLVARSLIPYESQRLGKEREFRSAHPESDHRLFNRFRSALGWRFARPDGTLCERHDGALLTGNKLIDHATIKDELTAEFPAAIGGEMEGAGIWSASEKNDTPWILVKGVCDWADGKKGSKYQELAAAAAVSLCLEVLQDERALDGVPEPRPRS